MQKLHLEQSDLCQPDWQVHDPSGEHAPFEEQFEEVSQSDS